MEITRTTWQASEWQIEQVADTRDPPVPFVLAARPNAQFMVGSTGVVYCIFPVEPVERVIEIAALAHGTSSALEHGTALALAHGVEPSASLVTIETEDTLLTRALIVTEVVNIFDAPTSLVSCQAPSDAKFMLGPTGMLYSVTSV